MLAAGIIVGLIVWIALSGYAWSWIVREGRGSEAEASGDYPYLAEGVKAGAESFRAGGAKVGADLRVTNANQLGVQVQNSTSQNPGSTTGRVAD